MPNLTLSIPHQLPRAEAKQRVQQLMSQLQQEYGSMIGAIEQNWNGDTLNFRVSAAGQAITGQSIVEDQAVRVEVALPWMLSMLAGSVKQQLEQHGRQLLEQH